MANNDPDYKVPNSSWQDVGSGAYRHNVEAAIEAGSEIPAYEETVDDTEIVEEATSEAEVVTEAATEGVQAEFDWVDAVNGPVDPLMDEYFETHPEMEDRYINHPLGYDPTFWQDPQRVARYYNAIKAAPPGATLPEFMTPEFQQQVEQAYQYFEFRNGGESWTNWQYLNKADQALPLLAGMQAPPPEFLWPGEEKFAPGAAQGPNIEAVMSGQAAWGALPEDQRKAILTAPTFDITQYDPMVRQQMLADPLFNWDALPDWQKTFYKLTSNPYIMSSPMALAGAQAGRVLGTLGMGVGALVGYGLGVIGGQAYDPTKSTWEQPSVAAGLMKVLNGLSEGTEQALGYVGEVYDAAAAGMQGDLQAEIAAKKMIFDPVTREAAWEAGRLTYEYGDLGGRLFTNLLQMGEGFKVWDDVVKAFASGDKEKAADLAANFINNVPLAQSGQDFILGYAQPVDKAAAMGHNPITGKEIKVTDVMGVLQQARHDIEAAIRAGEDPDAVILQYMNEAAQFVGAQVQDLAFQSIADPLNILPEVAGAATAGLLERAAGGQVDLSGAPRGPYDVIKDFSAQVKTKIPVENLSELSGTARWLAGVNEKGEITAGVAGLYPSETLTSTKIKSDEQVGLFGAGAKSADGWFRHMLTLTPEARARTGISMAMDNLGTILNTLEVDQIEPFFTALANSDMAAMKELAGNVVGSAEFYTVLPMLQGWNKLGELAGMWEMSAENRGLLGRLSDVLGMDAARLVEDLGKRDGAARVWEQVRQLVAKGTDSVSKSLLDDMNAGRFTVEDLQAIGKTFNGADALPWHPGAYKAMIMDSLGKHAAEWSKGYFGLKPDSGALRLAHTLKGAQSLLLLGFNPGYLINNTVNNVATRAASGVFGFMTPGQMRDWTTRFGITPDRMREGVGMGGETAKGASKSDAVLRDAMKGKGALATADNVVRAVNDKIGIFANASKKMEGFESAQAYTIGMQKGWDRFWKRGSGFRQMDAGMVKMLRDIDPSLPDLVYRAIEGGMNQKEIEGRLAGTAAAMQVHDLARLAAKQTGMSMSQAITLLDQAGILGALDGYLKNATTLDKVDAAFKMVDARAQDWIDIVSGNEARNNAQHVSTRIKGEGAHAVFEVVLGAFEKINDRWLEHYMEAGDVAAQMEAIDPEFQGQIALLWGDWRRRSIKEWTRTNNHALGVWKGVIDGLGLKTPEAQRIVSVLSDQFRTWNDAYEFAQKQYDAYYETWKGKFSDRNSIDARMVEMEGMKKRIDGEFKKAFEIERVKQEQFRDLLADQMKLAFGEEAYKATLEAYQQVLDFRAEMVKMLQDFRKEVENLYGADRRAAKAKFYQDQYLPRIAEMRLLYEDGIRKVQKIVTGEGGGPPVGEAGAPVKPTPPPTPPKNGAGGAARITRITEDVRQKLYDAGYSEQQVDGMLPIDAQEALFGTGDSMRARLSPENQPRKKAAIDHATTADNVWKVAREVGITGLDEFGQPVSGAKLDVIKFVKKWGGTDGAHIKTFADITPELMRKAVDSKKAWEQDQLSLPKIGDNAEALKTESEGLAEPKEATNEASDKALASAQDVQSVKVESKVANKHIADLPAVIRDSLQYELSVMRSILSDEPARNIFTAIREQGGIDPKFAKEMFGTSAQEMGMPPGFWRKDGFDPYRMAILLAEDGWPIDVKNPFDMDGIESLKKMIERRKGRSESWSDAFKTKKAREDALFALDALTRGLDKPDQVLYQNLKGIAEAMVLDDPVISDRWDWAKAWGAEDDILFRIDQRMKAVVDEALQAAADGDAVTMDMKFNQFIDIMSETPKEIAGEFIKVMNDEGKRVATDETYSQYFDRMYDELGRLNEAATAELLNAQAELALADQKATAEMKMTRELLREKLTEKFTDVQPEMIDATLKLLDERAELWAKQTGNTAAEWYASRVADRVRADGSAELYQSFFNDATLKEIRDGYRGLESHPEWIDKAIQRFGLTENINEAGYLLPDGRMLDFSGKKEGGTAGYRSYDHRQISEIGVPEINGKHLSPMTLFAENTKSLRFDIRNGDVYVNTFSAVPTPEQVKVITSALKRGSELFWDVTDSDGRVVFSKSVKGANIEKVMSLVDMTGRIFEGKESAKKLGGDVLYQQGVEFAKGGVTFLEDGRAVIHAFEGADISTIVHEIGHIFRRDLSGADLKAAEEWAGVKDGAWTREAEEKFARGFEKYLADGSAPSKALKAVFAKLKDWLVGVYQVIAGSPIDVNLTPEIKGVFDRLLAENPLYRVEVDTKARIEALAETTGTDFFTEMKAKAAELRAQKEAGQGVKRSAAEVAANQDAINARSREVDRLRAEREAAAANQPLGIDQNQKAADVAEIAETDFFRQLKADRDRIMAQRTGAGVSAEIAEPAMLFQSEDVDAGMVGGLLPGMRDIQGENARLFDVQPGGGKITKMEAPNAKSVTDVVPGKAYEGANGTLKRGDIVEGPDGQRYNVAGVNARGQLVTVDGKVLDGSKVKKVASQSSMLFQKESKFQMYQRKLDSSMITQKLKPSDVYQTSFVTPSGRQMLGFPHEDIAGWFSGNVGERWNVQQFIYETNVIRIFPDRVDFGIEVSERGVTREQFKAIKALLDETESGDTTWDIVDKNRNYIAHGYSLSDLAKELRKRNTSPEPTMLFQSADPRMPLGGIDQAAGFVPEGAILDETYAASIKPLLEAMRAEARKQSGQKKFNFADLPPEAQAGLNSYVKKVVKQDMPSAKLATVRYGEGLRDFALLNYNKKYGFDKYILDPVVPYQFWTTRTGMNTIVRLLDKPAMFATLFRTMRFMSQYERDLPDRLKGKMKVEVPFLPEWMGGSVYIDPLKTMFPLLNFLQPFEQMQKDKNAQVMEAERVLTEWAQAEKYSQAEIGQAVQTRSGSVWEAALAEASIRRKAEISNPADFMATILGPAWYLTAPYKLAMGQGNEISQLPITRTAQAIQTATAGTWAEGIGNVVGLLAKPETILRDKLGLPQYGEYGEYYIDRQIANLVAEGLVTPEQAKMAMTERSGDVYALAEERVRQELMMRVPGGSALYAGLHGGIDDMLKAMPTSLFGAGLLPEGELQYRGLKEKWNAAWDAYDAGDKEAITQFFEDHPEYEVYLMKGQTPDERLRTVLTGQIWDSYMSMDKATRRIVTAQLGPTFQHAFLNSETRSPESLDVETLARWSMMLGNDVPETKATEQVVNMPQVDQPMLEGLPTETSAAMAQYDMQKAQQFPMIYEIQNLYYASSDADRAQILTIYPQLREYWDWRRAYIEAHPEAAPFLDRDVAEGILSGELSAQDYGLSPDQAERLLTYYNTEFSTPVHTADYYLKGASPYLLESLSAHQLTGAPLTEGTYKELELIWKAYGMPGESFTDWLENVIYATIGY